MSHFYLKAGFWLLLILVITGFVPVLQMVLMHLAGGLLAGISMVSGYNDPHHITILNLLLYVPMLFGGLFIIFRATTLLWLITSYGLVIFSFYPLMLFVFDPIIPLKLTFPIIGSIAGLLLVIAGYLKDRRS